MNAHNGHFAERHRFRLRSHLHVHQALHRQRHCDDVGVGQDRPFAIEQKSRAAAGDAFQADHARADALKDRDRFFFAPGANLSHETKRAKRHKPGRNSMAHLRNWTRGRYRCHKRVPLCTSAATIASVSGYTLFVISLPGHDHVRVVRPGEFGNSLKGWKSLPRSHTIGNVSTDIDVGGMYGHARISRCRSNHVRSPDTAEDDSDRWTIAAGACSASRAVGCRWAGSGTRLELRTGERAACCCSCGAGRLIRTCGT